MLNEILDNLKKTVPDAFVDNPVTIPWIKSESLIVNIKKVFPQKEETDISPSIFIDPNTKIPTPDNELADDILKKGTEALAWHVSFHQNQHDWGIYIRNRGLFFLSNLFKSKNNVNDINEGIKLAFDLLFYHEFFHFITDMVSANMEMIYKNTIYNNYRNELPTDEFQIEEPLANVYCLRKLPLIYHSRIRDFFERQPEPYKHFGNYETDVTFANGKKELGAIIRVFRETSKKERQADLLAAKFDNSFGNFPTSDEPFWEFTFNVEPEKTFMIEIPIYFVSESHPNGELRFVTPIIYETKIAVYPGDHPPPHLHIWMPADSKKCSVYLYPSLTPYRKAKPLSNKQRKFIEDITNRYKVQLERELEKIKENN